MTNVWFQNMFLRFSCTDKSFSLLLKLDELNTSFRIAQVLLLFPTVSNHGSRSKPFRVRKICHSRTRKRRRKRPSYSSYINRSIRSLQSTLKLSNIKNKQDRKKKTVKEDGKQIVRRAVTCDYSEKKLRNLLFSQVPVKKVQGLLHFKSFLEYFRPK